MGIKAMEWVWDNFDGNSANRLVMLRIAHHANDETGEAFPSIETLRVKTRLSERYVHTIIKDLESNGVISVDRGGGRASNTYRILGYVASLNGVAHTASSLIPPSPLNTNATVITPAPQITPKVSDKSPLSCPPNHPYPDLGITPTLIPKSPELSYNNPLTTIEKNKSIKSIVIPVGDDTAPKISLDAQTITQEGKNPHPTPLPVTPTSPAKITTIEGVALTPSTPQPNSVDIPNIQTQPPPVAPPRADRPLSDQQRMTGAIVEAFGWTFKTMTRSNKSLVGKIARDLLEASATPDQIPDLYAFCKAQNWSGGFTPGALASQWANFCATQSTSSGEIFPVWKPPPGYVGVKFDYPPRSSQTVSDDKNDPYIGLTVPEMREKFNQFMNTMVDNMTIEETPIPEDDPLNEVLKW